jgi:secreted trypsin-like serine protease
MRRPRLALAGVLLTASLLVPAAAHAQTGGTVQPKVVGGSQVDISQYPWQAALVDSPQKVSGTAHDRQFCGGSLLTSRIVITAGHCVSGFDPDCLLLCSSDPLEPDDLDVVLGQTQLSTAPGSAETPVQAIKVQGNYDNNDPPRFDVAYLVLASASGFPQIKIAGPDEGALWDPGSSEQITGWGSTSKCNVNCGPTSDFLRAATVPIIADSSCSSTNVYGSLFDPNTMVCAGYLTGGVDTCAGDSGGPLQAPLDGGGYRLVGITSWGRGCAQNNAPGVYTRVAGTALHDLIQSDVSNLEALYGLPAEGPFGTGGNALGTSNAAGHPFAKCKRIHDKRKRKRCIKRVRKKLNSGV